MGRIKGLLTAYLDQINHPTTTNSSITTTDGDNDNSNIIYILDIDMKIASTLDHPGTIKIIII